MGCLLRALKGRADSIVLAIGRKNRIVCFQVTAGTSGCDSKWPNICILEESFLRISWNLTDIENLSI